MACAGRLRTRSPAGSWGCPRSRSATSCSGATTDSRTQPPRSHNSRDGRRRLETGIHARADPPGSGDRGLDPDRRVRRIGQRWSVGSHRRVHRLAPLRDRSADRPRQVGSRRMASDLTMPRLDESMEEGTILKWLVEEGGEIKKGEPLVEIETDKATTTYDAEVDGKLLEIVAKEGSTLAVGQPIARIDAANGSGDSDGGGADAGGADADAAASGPDPAFDPETVKASPVAERVAQDEGVELESVQGSGAGGKVVKADVELAAK